MKTILISVMLSLAVSQATANSVEGAALVLVERQTEHDRNLLLANGVPIVFELNGGFLAHGDLEAMASAVARVGFGIQVLDPSTRGSFYSLGTIHSGDTPTALSACGVVVWSLDNLVLLESQSPVDSSCLGAREFSLQPLSMKVLFPTREPLARFRDLALPGVGVSEDLVHRSLVQEMVDSLTSTTVVDNWDAIVSGSTTRYSTSAGCETAAAYVHDRFTAMGLDTNYQTHRASHADNIIGELIGAVSPDDVFIVVGHLDDMPNSGPAPGADDNGSGSGMVLSLAQVMSEYAFQDTVRFLSVTGEEFGLYGSAFYACQAYARDEKIRAVLNGDMIAWQGDGLPALEDLDVSYDGASAWLGTLMTAAAVDYGAGSAINAFSCPGMTRSDHASFWRFGYPAILGITDNGGSCGQDGFNPFYHSIDDTIANCGDPSFYVGVVKAYLATLAQLARPICRNPAAPVSASAVVTGSNSVVVSWPTAAGKLTYEVFRKPGGCASTDPFISIGETPLGSITDANAPSTVNNAYVVRVRDKSGYCLSKPSVCVEADPPGQCTAPPVFAGVASINDDAAVACGLTLTWPAVDAVRCGSAGVFNVYRSTDPDFDPGPGDRIAACLTSNSFTDTEVDPFVAYTYVVRAEDDTSGHGGACGGNEERNVVRLSGTATGVPTQLFVEDFEGSLASWRVDSPWAVDRTEAHGGVQSAYGGNEDSTCASLTLKTAVDLPAGAPSSLSFWSSFMIESCYDGLQVQVSVDGGGLWELGHPVDGYGAAASASCAERLDGPAFSGDGRSWTPRRIDLTPWAGQAVLVRFVMVSDGGVASGGFYLDDVQIDVSQSCGTGLVARSHLVRDSCGAGGAGDGDGILDPGEEVVLELVMTNFGQLPATGVSARLLSAPGITLIDATASFADIAAGADVSSDAPHLSFRLASGVACGGTIDLEVVVTSATRVWTVPVVATIGDAVTGGTGTALVESFDGPGLPPTWTVVDGFGDGATWRDDTTDDPLGCQGVDPGEPITGGWAVVDSDCAGVAPMDEELISPVVDLAAAATVELEFDHFFRRFLTETAAVDVRSTLTGGAWVTIATWQASTANPEHVSLDLTLEAAGASDVEIRWRYSDANDDLYWYVDNVVVSYSLPGSCSMTTCATFPDEVSPSGSSRPLLLTENPTLCPDGTCMYFGKEANATGYNIYEGSLGVWYSHDGATGNVCDATVTEPVPGMMQRSFAPDRDRYYLVTAFNSLGEGTAGGVLPDVGRSCPP